MVEENDNISDSDLNSRIEKNLSAGTYTVEATTYFYGQLDDFTLTIQVQ